MTIVMTTNKRPHRHEILWMDEKWNRKDRKSNLHHHATKRREGFKRQREALLEEYENELKYYLWGIVYNAGDAA